MNKVLCGSIVAMLALAGFARAEEKPGVPLPTVGEKALDPGYVLAWSDEFDGDKLDPEKWVYRTDSKHWSIQLPENVSVSGGLLRLKLTKLDKPREAANTEPGKDPKDWKVTAFKYGGAGVITKPAFRHGYYECRMRLPGTAGWHNSFWMQNHNGEGNTLVKTAFQEIDVCENDSVKPTHFGANLHQWRPTHKAFGVWHLKTPDLSSDFHVWGCEYTPEKIRFFFQGKEFASTDKHTTFENNEQHIWLTSIATHLGGAKQVDESRLPVEMAVDYVRFFEKKPVQPAAAAPVAPPAK